MKKTILTLTLAALMMSCATQPKQEFYEKHVAFPADATVEQKIDMVSRLVPTPQQLEWQQMEFTAFLHFGIAIILTGEGDVLSVRREAGKHFVPDVRGESLCFATC